MVIFSESWEEHLHHLREVLDRLKQARLTLKLKKCCFGKKGSRLSRACYRKRTNSARPKQNQSHQEVPHPSYKEDIRAWLGLTGYYRRFVPEYATVAAPLTGLLKKGLPDKIKWTSQTNKAFEQLKATLLGPTLLKVAGPEKPFILHLTKD